MFVFVILFKKKDIYNRNIHEKGETISIGKEMAMDKTQSISENHGKVSLRFSPAAPTAACWVMLLQLEGITKCEINREPVTLQTAQACLLRPTDRCRFQVCEDNGCLSFLVESDYIRSLSNLLDVNLYPELLNSTKLLQFTLTDDFLRVAGQKAAETEKMLATPSEYNRSCMLQFQELYIQFLTQHAYEPTNYPDWLASLLLSLQDVNLFGMSMSQFASTTPYSYSRLSRLFQNYTGVSLIDYVTDVKIRHAKELLKNTNMTMLAIASKLEFSISYFNKLFKRKVGITPGEYRKRNQKM